MGGCAKATYSYGIVLDEDQIAKLLHALGIEDGLGAYNWLDDINNWLGSLQYCFSAENSYEEGKDEDDTKLVIAFEGDEDDDQNKHELEIWGSDTAGMAFKVIPDHADNEEFMKHARTAFQALKGSEAFKGAELTEIRPRWILKLTVG
ncbi:hypothetical protein H0H87_012210 [Tephrocybe sp. NHM501043]|nr:hypothetical protein H0H87_012210 [Tephrocybe sp. NHM501043]